MKRKNIVGLIVIVAIVVVVMFAGCVEENTSGPTPKTAEPTPEPTPTTAPAETPTLKQTPSTTIEEAKEYLISSLESDPVIVDAGVTVEGTTASIVVVVAGPEDSDEIDRVYTLSATMAKVFLTEHGVNNVLIGVYKGETQLKLDAEWL